MLIRLFSIDHQDHPYSSAIDSQPRREFFGCVSFLFHVRRSHSSIQPHSFHLGSRHEKAPERGDDLNKTKNKCCAKDKEREELGEAWSRSRSRRPSTRCIETRAWSTAQEDGRSCADMTLETLFFLRSSSFAHSFSL